MAHTVTLKKSRKSLWFALAAMLFVGLGLLILWQEPIESAPLSLNSPVDFPTDI
ncbi:MAG: hypothetical protein ACYYK0_01845 [Candidatus Eutrophobiaceae bacterium]